MNESTILITHLIEHYDAVEHLRHAVQIIGGLALLLLIQTSRVAFHRGKHESLKRVLKERGCRCDGYCEEITWHRDNASRLEARLFNEPLPPVRQADSEEA